MALIDLTNVDPWGKAVEAQKRANDTKQRALQGALQSLQQNIQRGVERRQKLADRDRAIRDREYSLINNETNTLIQPKTNSKITDIQLQQTGQNIKQEYYDAIKAYEQSDKGDEARQAFEQAKQRALSSARTISGSLDKLGAAVETFRSAYNSGGISPAMNPAVREFMADLQDPNADPSQYQIVPDEETGQMKYVGVTSGGSEVNFFLDDLANGENQFAPIPKADMPKIMSNLLKDVSAITKQEERDWGIAEVTDWDAMGDAIEGRMDQMLQDETNFRAIAAGLGYGWEQYAAAKSGVEFEDGDGRMISDLDGLKDAVKQEMMEQIEATTPHQEKRLYEYNPTPTLAQQAQQVEALENQKGITEGVVAAAGKEDLDYFKQNLIGRVKGVDNIAIKKGKLVMGSGFGKNFKPTQVFDLSSQGDLYRLTELFGGNRDLAAMESSIINF